MIVHLDADAFYASVEQASDPRLRGKAIAVGGAKRGIIASASYEARRQGVFTPMPTARAMKVCPRLIVVPGDFDKYEHFSEMMFSYAYDFTPDVEIQGIDEGYFSLRGGRKPPEDVAATVRKAIYESLKITVSEGVASNKLVSQVASKYKKPNTLTFVALGTERAFLSPLPNAWLPGIGPKAAQTLNAAGLANIGQIALAGPGQLSLIMGSGAPLLCQFAQGIDDRPIMRESVAAKSYGSQETFDQDQTDEPFLVAKLRSISDRLMAKVREDGKMIRTVTVKVRYNDMEEEQRAQSLAEPTSYEGDLYSLLHALLKKAWTRRVSLRLVSVKLSGVYDALFEDELGLDHVMGQGKKIDLCATVDRIRSDFGNMAIMRGHDLWLRHKRADDRRGASGAVVPPASISRRAPKPMVAELPVLGAGSFLNFKSCYSFMDSLLRPREIVKMACDHGAKAVAMTDPNLHGLVEFCQAANESGIRPIIGAELQISGGIRAFVNAYVKNETGYANLCSLLSHERLTRKDVDDRSEGLILVPLNQCGPEIRYATPGDRSLYAIVQSIRTLTLLKDQHPDKRKGAFHFRGEMFSGARVAEIMERCRYQPEWGGHRFPRYIPRDGSTPHDFLRCLTMKGAQRRYGARFSTVLPQLEEELRLIAIVGYEGYFLLTWELLQECKAQGIHWITRGSAADSLVCYCLFISGVCPIRFDLYFKRFLNVDRMVLNKLPDIDIDFPHDRRDEVVEMVLKKYGPHAAIVGGFQTYQGRSALADIAKVLGVSESQIRRLTERIPRTSAADVAQAVSESIECQDLALEEDPYKTALAMAHRLDGFPRHPKMHPCGVVLSREPIHSLTPTFISGKNWPTTHFDMDGVEAVGLVKMDLLCQAGLSVMRDTVNILFSQGTSISWQTLEDLEPWENTEIWEMIRNGLNRGVHHIESPAMLTLAKMCGVHEIDDLVAIVSVIRPGAANTMKKEQFARRCLGTEEPDYTHSSLAAVLRSTYGVVAYEEHVLQICEAFAGMSPGRGDIFRRALVKGNLPKIEEMLREFVDTARAFGGSEAEIKTVSELIIGFKGYAFCKAHSTAYGVEAYQAAHLKRYHPKEFLSCVLEHGKGFYSRLVYSIECRRLGYGFLSPDVNSEHDRFYPEPAGIRAPVKLIKGLTESTLKRFEEERKVRAYLTVEDFFRRVTPNQDEMQNLLRVGAFDSLDPSRTSQFWVWRRCGQTHSPRNFGQGLLCFDSTATAPESRTEPTYLDRLRAETELLGFPIGGHPLDLHPDIAWDRYCPISQLQLHPHQIVTVAGLIIEERLHHQTDGRMMKFISICDPTGITEVEIFADAYSEYGVNTIRFPVVEVEGQVMPLESKIGCTMQALAIRGPRTVPSG